MSGVKKITRKKDKVAIVGFAKSWTMTPFQDDDFEVWCLNEFYRYLQQVPNGRADRWFEIHNPESPSKNTPDHHKFLATCGIPVYMWQHFPQFPTSLPFPREEVKAMMNENMIYETNPLYKDLEYAKNGSRFSNFSNQITWMILLAIYEGFKEIHIYGVDMATKETINTADGKQIVTGEYVWQRPSCEAVIGYALGKGIKILVPHASELCKFPQDYGFETDNQQRCFLKGRKKELVKTKENFLMQKQQLEAQLAQIEGKIGTVSGAINELSWQLGNHIV